MREYCVCFINTTTGYWDECFVWAKDQMLAVREAMNQSPKHYKFHSVAPIQWA